MSAVLRTGAPAREQTTCVNSCWSTIIMLFSAKISASSWCESRSSAKFPTNLWHTHNNDNEVLLAWADIFRDAKHSNEGIPSDPTSAARKPCVVEIENVKKTVEFIKSKWLQKSYCPVLYASLSSPENRKRIRSISFVLRGWHNIYHYWNLSYVSHGAPCNKDDRHH